jgi:hypothetical protein
MRGKRSVEAIDAIGVSVFGLGRGHDHPSAPDFKTLVVKRWPGRCLHGGAMTVGVTMTWRQLGQGGAPWIVDVAPIRPLVR